MTRIKKQNKVILYCAGLSIILSIWLAFSAGAQTTLFVIKYVMLITLSYTAMVFDINTKRIPNNLVLIMITGWLFLIIGLFLTDLDEGFTLLYDSIYGSLIGGGLFLLVYLLSKKGLGGGDVKFMAAAGLYLGLDKTIPAILYGTVLAALTGLVLILLRKIGRKDTIPLAPFLFAGILVTVFTS